MDALSTFVRRSIPDYLSGLPVPNSIGGYFSLSGELSNQFMTGLIIHISYGWHNIETKRYRI